MAASSQSTPIRSFQFDACSVANVKSSVNLFSADVNLTQGLFTLPGRDNEQSLQVSVSLLYQSNVFSQAMLWNRDEPTGVLGLGWSMPGTAIVLQDNDSLAVDARQYAYVANGGSTPLWREADTPFLFAMPGRLANGLADGQPVPSGIRRLFGAHGLSLGANAYIANAATSRWTIIDDDEQQLFSLRADGDELRAFDGGQSYQLQSYKFWKILYYPTYERWLIVNDSGQRQSFGGLSGDAAGTAIPASVGNSIVWGVAWRNPANGELLWTGASGVTGGQAHFAQAWQLAVTSNLWGDRITYTYNEQWPIDPVSGLRPIVEQAVCVPGSVTGLGYTKASYLTGITDVFGRHVVFHYADKLWDDSTPESPREYADPHKATPDNQPNAWQDRYETQYLASISVTDPSGVGLLGIDFIYAPRPGATGAASQVANISDNTGSRYGDSFKRFLTGLVFRTGDNSDAAGTLVMDYWLESEGSATPDASPGAIRRITYPGGASAAWQYTKQYLTSCDRSLTVTPPGDLGTSATPTIWYGPDYAVSLWYDALATQLTLQVHSWIGHWVTWQLDPVQATLFAQSGGFDPSSLNVTANQECLAVSFNTAAEMQVYLFNKAIAQPGQWSPALLKGTTTGINQPTLRYSIDSAEVLPPVGGTHFLLIAQMNATYGRYAIDRLTWRWTTREWSLETTGEGDLPALSSYTWVTAQGEYYLTVDLQGHTVLTRLGADLIWRTGGETVLPDMENIGQDDLALVPSASWVAASRLRTDNSSTCAYTLHLLQWDAAYQFLPVVSRPFSDAQDPSGANPTTWIPEPVDNSLLACAGHVMRFDGQRWLVNSALTLKNVPKGQQQRFAYGQDVAIRVLTDGDGQGEVTAALVSYDPDTDTSGWHAAAATTPAAPLRNPDFHASTANYPSMGGSDYLVIGPWLYFRDHSSDWGQVVGQAPVGNLQATLERALATTGEPARYVMNSQALINEASDFLACCVFNGGASNQRTTAVMLLENGQLSDSTDNPVLLPEDEQLSLDNKPGSSPAGPSMFVTYPGTADRFADAQQFTLHQYVGNAVNGAVFHYAVTGFHADNGFDGPQPSTIVPDLSTATCDTSGTRFKYYQSTVYPGSSAGGGDDGRPDPARYGSVRVHYLNGLYDQTGGNFYNMLDGLLIDTTVMDADGQELSRTALDWKVWTQRSPAPGDASVPPVNLAGGFVSKTAIMRSLDGVTSRVQLDSLGVDAQGRAFEAPWSSQVVAKWQTMMGSSGTPETQTSRTLYGCERDPVLRALNILSAQAQSSSFIAINGGPEIPTSATAYSRALWPCIRGSDILVPAVAGTYAWQGLGAPDYPFGYAPAHEIDPPGWRCQQRVTSRTLRGLSEEGIDASGIFISATYAEPDSMPVAQVTNASHLRGQWVFADFETEEGLDGWQVTGGAVIDNDAYSGRHSLNLPTGGRLEAAVTPAHGGDRYLLIYAIKTVDGYVPGNSSGWTVQVESNGALWRQQDVAFQDTQGIWLWQTVGIDLPADSDDIRVVAWADNMSEQSLLLDAVGLLPLVSCLSVQYTDPALRKPISALNLCGRQSITVYSRQGQSVATLGPDCQVMSLTQRFLSPQGNDAGRFDPASPGASLSLQAAGPSCMETFREGDIWRTRWDAAPASNWQVQDGTLVHTAGAAGNLTWKGWQPSIPTTAAVFAEFYAPLGLDGRLIWSLNNEYRLGWDPVSAGWIFEGPDGWSPPPPLARPPVMPQQWLLVFGDGIMLFFGNGQLTYSLTWSAGVPSDLALEVPASAVQVRNLATLAAPRLSLSYLDGTGTVRQTQALNGADARIQQTVQDLLGRTVASTKSAPARFGQDAGLPLMAYHPHLVDVQAFLAATADSWLMQGDVADFYAGQGVDGVARSDDQGYPYNGTRFEASPRKRKLEAGQAGRTLAIHDLLTTSAATRLTTQYQYGSTLDAAYFARGSLDPHKTLTTSITTVGRQKVARQVTDAQGIVVSQTHSWSSFRAPEPGPAGMRQSITLPNGFSDPPQGGETDFVAMLETDMLVSASRAATPDIGSVETISDRSGRLRFQQMALDAGESWYLYIKYDALGRTLEEGTIQAPWDAPALIALAADDPFFPNADSGVPFQISRQYRYDGDGDDPRQISRLVEVSTWSYPPEPDGTPWQSVEQFHYDTLGHVRTARLTVSVPGVPSAETAYRHNALGEVTELILPAGTPLRTLRYQYNDLGQVNVIQADDGPNPVELARYAYAVTGGVVLEALNNGALQQRYSYNSPGWLTQQSLTLANQSQPVWTVDTAFNALGKTRARRETLAFADNPVEQTEFAYDYDALGRLQQAGSVGSHSGDWQAESYDANGNLWAAKIDGQSLQYAGQPGTDRLATARLPGQGPIEVHYNARGQLTHSGDLAVAYDVGLGKACAMQRALDGTIIGMRVAYGGAQQRTIKQVNDGTGTGTRTRLYVCGAGTQPLAVWEDGEWTNLVQGPTGLLALAWTQAGIPQPPCFPLKDAQSSVRVLVDGAGRLTARYRYGLFGAPLAAEGDHAHRLSWRFMGQEWDEEVGVYNFQARLYAPGLCRFLQPDPGGQFASPYVFVGNDPVSMVDTNGAQAHWAQLAVSALAAAVTIAGAALTVMTAGGSDAAAAEIDADLTVADAGADLMGDEYSPRRSSSSEADDGSSEDQGGEQEIDTGSDGDDDRDFVNQPYRPPVPVYSSGWRRWIEIPDEWEGGKTTMNKTENMHRAWWGGDVPIFSSEVINNDRIALEDRLGVFLALNNPSPESIDTEAHERVHKWISDNWRTWRWITQEGPAPIAGLLQYPEEVVAHARGHYASSRYLYMLWSFTGAFTSVRQWNCGGWRGRTAVASAATLYYGIPTLLIATAAATAVAVGVGVGVGVGTDDS